MDIIERLRHERLFYDGGYGTLLQSRGLPAGMLGERYNLMYPDTVIDIHREYLAAGADILETNTFRANLFYFDETELESVIEAAVMNARAAIGAFSADGRQRYIALSVGPTGKLLRPLGALDFEDAVNVFKATMRLGRKYGVDLVQIETVNDCIETKAAVLAAKEATDLPVFVTNAYDESRHLITGASPAAMAAMLEGLRVDALGLNCGLGPVEMLPVVRELAECASVPLIVNPNAGLPVLEDGKTVFRVTPEAFADAMEEIAAYGVSVLGGCCGTTPEHIQKLRERVQPMPYSAPTAKQTTVVSSYTHAVTIGNAPILIGERINPTGRKALRRALIDGDMTPVLNEAISEKEDGADILDVNMGVPELDETELLPRAVTELQAVSNLPLAIDTANPDAMARALRLYAGKPVINSVNGKRAVLDAVLPLAKRYGGVLIALTLDEDGIPETAEARVLIAERIAREAEKYGIEKRDLLIDPLCMSVAAEPNAARTTLQAIRLLNARGFLTSLGVSNVSFGLPERGIVNAAFYLMALADGLKAGILNPHDERIREARTAFAALDARDPQCGAYIAYATSRSHPTDENVQETAVTEEEALRRAIVKGLSVDANRHAAGLIRAMQPMELVQACIVPALDEIGKAFERKTAFLPQLLMSAEAAKAAFDAVRAAMPGDTAERKPEIVLATVRGDIHDIGKNIVRSLLENYGIGVCDLGRDVAPETILEAVRRDNVPLVGLSALMTTTAPAMEETIALLRREVPEVRIVVGGAVLTEEFARKIGADRYAADAMDTVRYAESVLAKAR